MIYKTKKLMMCQVPSPVLALSENVRFCSMLLGSSTQREAVPATTNREGNVEISIEQFNGY